MAYYIVTEDTEQIVGMHLSCPDVQEMADLFECSVYIIEGEHTGLSASPTTSPQSPGETG